MPSSAARAFASPYKSSGSSTVVLLTVFDAGDLLAFSVKLLILPAQVTPLDILCRFG
jgi:hypothetical protein